MDDQIVFSIVDFHPSMGSRGTLGKLSRCYAAVWLSGYRL